MSDVAEADEMPPTAPLLRVTTLPAAVGSKFVPEMTSDGALTARDTALAATVGGGGGGGVGSGDGLTHTPLLHAPEAAHAAPQPPQLVGSTCSARHSLAQSAVPDGHVAVWLLAEGSLSWLSTTAGGTDVSGTAKVEPCEK